MLLDRFREFSNDVTIHELRLADANVSAGDVEQGVALVEGLIQYRPDNLPAQLWLARHHLSLSAYESDRSQIRLDRLTQTSSRAALQHLARVFEGGHASSETVAIYAILLCQNGFRSRAERVLASAPDDDPATSLKLAKLQYQLGFIDDSRIRAKSLIHSQPVTSETELIVHGALIYAELFTLAGQWSEAAALLEGNLSRHAQDKAIGESLMQVWLRMASDSELLKEVHNPQEFRLSHLRKMQNLDYLNTRFQCLVAKMAFASEKEVDPNTRRYCKEVLTQAIDRNEVATETLVILGTGAARDGKMSAARLYLSKAYVRGNRSSALLNNLAWVLSQVEASDLRQALLIADQAVLVDGRSREARLTRADILICLGRFSDAIVDLEFVDRDLANTSEIASRMAKCYEALGENELATQFRKLATDSVL